MQGTRPATVWVAVLIAIIGTAVGSLAISGESVWIDEAHTAEKAGQPTLSQWWHLMSIDIASDAQMPLYMFYMWLWGKVAGTHPEILLRASNVLWLLVAQAALCVALRRWPAWMIASSLVLAIHPFTWFYMDEARPYIMQIASAVLVVGFFIRRFADPSPSPAWLAAFGVGLVLLCGSSMLGALWAGAALLLCLIARKDLGLSRQDWIAIAGTVVVLLAMGAYFVSTFLRDAKPTAGETNILNLAFAGYELLGLAGLGPGREEIRLHGIGAFKPYAAALLVAAIALSGFALGGIAWAWQHLIRSRWIAVALWILPVFVLFFLSTAGNFRLLGRHLTPILPLFVFAAAGGLVTLSGGILGNSGFRRVASFIAVLLLAGGAYATSSYGIRLADRHRKDDYRTAAAIAGEALRHGKTVWWCADPQGAQYYGLNPHSDRLPTGVRSVRNVRLETLRAESLPDILILTRPDVYDQTDEIVPFFKAAGWFIKTSFGGFSVWLPPDGSLAAEG